MRIFFLIVILFGISFAAEGGAHHSPLELFWKGFNILLFLGIVYWLARKPISEAFNNFWKSLYKSIEDSENELKKAQEELENAKEELEKAKVRADESLALARESAQVEVENAKKHAEEVAQRIRERARETIEVELKKAKEELALYGMRKAQEVAKEVLVDAFRDTETNIKYIKKQLKELEEVNAKK